MYDEMTSTHPQHRAVYMYMAMRSFGDVGGLRLIDMPSGEGKYSVELLQRGAAWVTSIDLAPKMLELTVGRVAQMGAAERHTTVEADATTALDIAARSGDASLLFDGALGNFLFEYCATDAALLQCATNVFNCLRDGAKFVIMYVPGAKGAEDIAHVKAVLGIEATVLDDTIAPGDVVKIKYHRMKPTYCYEIHYWPVASVTAALERAGFQNVHVLRCAVDPAYSGDVDLARFAAHSGNRHITCVKP